MSFPSQVKEIIKSRWNMDGIPPWTDEKWLVCIDPGETTGVTLSRGLYLKEFKQVPTPGFKLPFDNGVLSLHEQLRQIMCVEEIRLWEEEPYDALEELDLTIVVEDYRIYKWKTDEHTWSTVPTLRLIGAIEHFCSYWNLPLYKQTAYTGKSFWNDAKFEKYGIDKMLAESGSKTANRHARDALRHALQFLTFTYPSKYKGGIAPGATKPEGLKMKPEGLATKPEGSEAERVERYIEATRPRV